MKKTLLSMIALVLCLSMVYGQFTGSRIYDFRDGTIITAGGATDGSLTLGGTYGHHSTNYGLNMKAGGTIKIAVSENCALKFLGSKYSKVNVLGQKSNGDTLCIQDAKVTADLVDTYDFVYEGGTDTLTFTTITNTGSDLYLPVIDVIPSQLGADTTVAAKNVIYIFDLRDGSIIPAETSLNGNYTIEEGLFKIECGPSNAYGYNGADHGSILKTGNMITLQVAGNSYIKIGGCKYSNGTIAASSITGEFDIESQASATTNCYHQDGSTVDFLYVGDTGSVVLTFTGTTYIPVITIVPVPYAVELNPWAVKSGIITVNGTEISLTAGASSAENATVAVSEGTVFYATSEIAAVHINLGGNDLSSYTPTFTGDISAVAVNNSALQITYADESSLPAGYIINVTDNSQVAEAETGRTYSYAFNDGSVLPQTSYSSLRYISFVTSDGLVTINSNTTTTSGQFGYHDAQHGAVLFPGNSFDMVVAGNATITFGTCQYGSATDGIFEFTDTEGTVLGSCASHNIGTGACGTNSFTYTGAAGTITTTLKSASFPNAEVYIHGLTIENAPAYETSNGKTDVWDFGAQQFDETNYNNKLDSATINSLYAPTITPGSSGNVLPSSFSVSILSWVGGANDRLRTTNTKLTRYDENIASAVGYTGRIYVNAAANTGRYLSLTLNEDDEVSIIARTDAGGNINFQYVPDPISQTDVVAVSDLDSLKFVAKQAGTYHIFDTKGKPSYFRIYRKDATYVTINGTVDVSAADGIPAGYGINMANAAGKRWNAVVENNAFSIIVPAGYTYSLSLSDANGYIINNGNSLEVTESTSSYHVVIEKVDLYTVSGAITGLSAAEVAKLSLVYASDTAAHKIYIPEPVINTGNSTYSVQLEPDCKYTTSALGVNDYYIPKDSIIIGQADVVAELAFLAKPVYNVAISTTGLDAIMNAKLMVTYTNLNEEGYSYSFRAVSPTTLRDGVYSIAPSDLDEYPVQMGLAPNLKVAGTSVSKTLAFSPVTIWSFDDQVIPNGTTHYKGLEFEGSVKNEIAKGHLVTRPGAMIHVPIKAGQRLTITYYYSASFTINSGDTISTSSGSTSIFESVEFISQAGNDTIKVVAGAATTYITEVSVTEVIAYKEVIYVGTDKEYTTINDALSAISKMTRTDDQRVTVLIDPGNYEEMLVIDLDNISLVNASKYPSTEITNKGVDIDPDAVRITGYYGHGYNYYSMGTDQKWHADLLSVNKENGYYSYENKGSGTTNGSYWNSTVVVFANGFEAENVIFENSFNQYISKKESEDVVVEWESGGKGTRPTDMGNTGVQNRSFVERGCAIAFANNADKAILNRCRVIGRQDAFFGGTNARIVVYKGAVMGAVDFIYGAMTAVFYKTNLVMNTSDASSDAAYLTAAQQSSGRGYLMYECKVKSAVPGKETASAYYTKPGYFGRPWQATTSEVVFYNTTIDTSNFSGYTGQSLINPIGWLNSLGGESSLMYEYGTIEKSGADNSANRATWSTVLTSPVLTDGTEITTFNFTKGTDNWDPISDLNAVKQNLKVIADNAVKVYGEENPALTFSYKGFDCYEDETSLASAATASTTATAASFAGTYAITVSGAASDDYNFVYVDGVLTVDKAKLTATADSLTRKEGEANPTFTITYSGFVNNDDVSDITSPTASCSATTESAAGTYDIVLSGGSAANYNLELVNGTLTISPGSGINDNSSGSITIYPNPASEILNIDGIPEGTGHIMVIGSKGQVIMEQQVYAENTLLDISALPAGLYVIKINDSFFKLMVR